MKKVVNPFNQDVLGSVNLVSKEQAFEIVDQGENVVYQMAGLSSCEKSRILNDIIWGVKKRYDIFISTIIKESAKPYRYAKAEVDRALVTFTIAAEECKRISHELIDLDQTEKGVGLKGEVCYVPKGLILGISPFNFPLNLAVHKIAPAIASGCPIVLKPSSKTPMTMELLKEVIDETDLPSNAFQLIHCSRDVGNELIRHNAFKVVSFTGSPTVGWEMKANAGKKSVVLELGGNAAAIVCKDADVNNAISELVMGGFAYAGQVCIHTQRVYVHKDLYDSFLIEYKSRVEALVFGDPLSEKTEFSNMIDTDNAKRVEIWVKEAVESGAKIVCGGNRKGSFYPPTILTNVASGEKVREEEVFGPVVIIERFKTMEEAIDLVNDSRWGLQAAIFTDSIKNRSFAFDNLNVGSLIHNRSTTFRVDNMPYGGIKDSGFGREGVRYAMMDFLEPKLLVR